MINIRLLGDRLIVRPIPFEQVGAIELPNNLKDDHVNRPKLYWVMVTGPGRKNRKGVVIPIECQYGDRVILHSYTKGVEDVNLPHGDVIVTEDQILLVLPKASPA